MFCGRISFGFIAIWAIIAHPATGAEFCEVVSDCCNGTSNDVKMADPSDCTTYYICINNQAVQYRCRNPEPPYFNNATEECDVLENVPHCSGGSPSTTPPPLCDPTGRGNFPYPGNCTLYIKCFEGIGQVFSCAPWIFDVNDLDCKPKGEAVCDEVECPSLDAKCLFTEDEDIPHMSSCSKYYECRNGIASESECAANMYFDAKPDQLRCNQAELALCDSECSETGIEFQAIRSSGCKWYKICHEGLSVNMECRADQVYSPIESKCVAEGSYTCPYA